MHSILNKAEDYSAIINPALDTMKEFGWLNPMCAGLAVAFKGIIDVKAKFTSNAESSQYLIDLITRITSIFSTLEKLHETDSISETVSSSLEELKILLEDVKKFLEQYCQEGMVKGFLDVGRNLNKLQQYDKDVNKFLSMFNLSLQVSIFVAQKQTLDAISQNNALLLN